MNEQVIYRELIARYSKTIRFVIGNYFKNSMDRDYVYQETMIHIYEQLQKSSELDLERWTAEGWIKVIVKNKCISILRVQQRDQKKEKHVTDDSQLEFEIESSSMIDQGINDGAKSTKVIRIRELLNTLNERDRQLLILRYFKNYSIKELDDALGMKNAAVYILRAVEKLKKEVGVEQFFTYFDSFDIEDDENLIT
jgi:RNA polymerase sigma factor (sigma-70 family)